MALPDVSSFLAPSDARWRALGDRLRGLGFTAELERVQSVGGQVFDPMCAPLRRWHLARSASPAAPAVRLLATTDAVAEPLARAALGSDTIDDLVGVGVVERLGAGDLRARLKLRVHDSLLFYADDLVHGGDAVMGVGALTPVLFDAALPAEGGARIESALELGCGAAVNALRLARRVPRVVATDVSERAVTLGRVNAALNGIDHVDFRVGDLFAPVAGETFDRVIAQPPFIPMPDAAAPTVYMYGGRRGDELSLRLLAGLAEHVAPGGRGLVVAEWPVLDGDEPRARIEAAIGDRANALLLCTDGPDLDAFCIGDAAHAYAEFGAAYEEAVIRARGHLERLGVRALGCIVVAVERPRQRAWAASVDLATEAIEGAVVDSLFRVFELLAQGDAALLAARLAVRPGVAFAVGAGAPGSGLEGGASVRVSFPAGSPFHPVALDTGAHRIATWIDASPSVRTAARRYAKEARLLPQLAEREVADAAARLLRAGILVVAGGP